MGFKKLPICARTPEGFRLATFGEVTSNFSMLRTQHILTGSEYLRLLDSVFLNGKEISFEDDYWPMEMLVVGETPTPISTNSSLLRKKLYSEISLPEKRRRIALRLSCLFGDIEVINWLLCESEFKSQLKEQFWKEVENEVKKYFPDFLIVVKILCGSIQIGEAEVAESLDYALKVNQVLDNALAIVEIVVDKCREAGILLLQDIFNSQIRRLAKMTVDENQAEAKRIGVLPKLLSECADPLKHEDEVIRPNFQKLLMEAIRRGYNLLTDALLRLVDTEYELDKDEMDKPAENLVHYAAKREYGYKIVNFLGQKCENLIGLRNEEGRTPLHLAAVYGNREVVSSIYNLLPLALNEALKATDYAGRTPLHLAAFEGDERTVQEFLKCGSDPFERDIAGKTAVHYAVRNTKGSATARQIVEALLKHLECNKRKALLLWISAAGIGTADQVEDIDPGLKKFLEKQKLETSKDVNVLEEAAMSEDLRLIWEFLNRGGDISTIEDKSSFRRVTKAINKFSQLAADHHTLVDTLGQNVLVECISAHFLNPYIKSPITVSVSGGSGTGKSSLMYQIEAYLLITASQLAFPYLWENENFNGARKISLSSKGVQICHKIEKGVYNLLGNKNYRDFNEDIIHLSPRRRPTMSLLYLLREYLPKCKNVYKSLTCMDVAQLMEEGENTSVHEIEGRSLGAVPRILTVNFNAGNYRGRTEAWAGLAIEITKEIEASMTWAHLLSTRWRNIWTRNGPDFYLRFIFPAFLLAFVGAWIGWAAWKLLDREGPSELKDIKYGSVTATVLAIVWSILSKIVSVFQPISAQMSGYFSLPDHLQQLGYQQKVIADIQFLKEEIGKKPCFFFSFIAGEMCKNWWGLWKESVEGTCIPKYGSAPEGKLRIIAFVDDLDQCEETVILRMLWAINLVFKVCEINVILTMDKATIETAYRKSSLVQDNDFADEFISKIVQLPVNIPDPTDDEWVEFLDTAMLRSRKFKRDSTNVDTRQTPASAQNLLSNELSEINGGNLGDPDRVRGPQDIESGKSSIKWEGWCMTFLANRPMAWLKGIASCFLSFIYGILHFLGFVVCNIREENQRHQHDYEDDSELIADCRRILFQRLQQVRESWMLSYTDEEAEAFHQLKCYATGNQKVPREWKCYITYHNFAKNIVSKMAKGKKFPVGWEVEFMVWTFVCLQWKHEINVLIQDWYTYAYVKDNKGTARMKASLKKIVADYIGQRKWGEQTGFQLGDQAGKQVFIVNNCIQSSSLGSEEKERQRWENLRECLENLHDVSMDGIRCFQHLRYHCDARNLVPKLYKQQKHLHRTSSYLSL